MEKVILITLVYRSTSFSIFIPEKEILTLNEFPPTWSRKQFVEWNGKAKFQRQPENIAVAVNHLLMPRVAVSIDAAKPRFETRHRRRCVVQNIPGD